MLKEALSRRNKRFRPNFAPIQGRPALAGPVDREIASSKLRRKDALRLFAREALEQAPKKLRDFFDENLLQLFDFERFLIDHMIPCDRETL